MGSVAAVGGSSDGCPGCGLSWSLGDQPAGAVVGATPFASGTRTGAEWACRGERRGAAAGLFGPATAFRRAGQVGLTDDRSGISRDAKARPWTRHACCDRRRNAGKGDRSGFAAADWEPDGPGRATGDDDVGAWAFGDSTGPFARRIRPFGCSARPSWPAAGPGQVRRSTRL
jgi:hypothetical protein